MNSANLAKLLSSLKKALSIASDTEPDWSMEIAIFETIDGKKVSRNLSDYSNIAEMMKGYLDVIRVYTFEKNRAKVGKAAREVFQEVPDTALIHM